MRLEEVCSCRHRIRRRSRPRPCPFWTTRGGENRFHERRGSPRDASAGNQSRKRIWHSFITWPPVAAQRTNTNGTIRSCAEIEARGQWCSTARCGPLTRAEAGALLLHETHAVARRAPRESLSPDESRRRSLSLAWAGSRRRRKCLCTRPDEGRHSLASDQESRVDARAGRAADGDHQAVHGKR